MAEIEYFCFPMSPFSYLAGMRLEEVAARHGASITYKPFELLRVFSETGTPMPKDRHESRRRYRLQEIERIGRFNEMPVNLHPAHWPTNTVPACCAIITAQETGGGDVGRLLQSLLRACWAEEKDIAEDSVIRDCLEAAGFDPALAEKGMLTSVEKLQRNTDEALQKFVFGAPTYVVGEQVFWGQDRLPHLDAYLASLT